jgi:hypothetical protein
MADSDLLHADLVNFAPNDGLLLVYLPDEDAGKPKRRMRFYQLDRAAVWAGVGQGAPVPEYVVPGDDPPPPPPNPPPPPWTENLVVVTDYLRVRGAPSLSGTTLRQVKRGVVLTVVIETTPILADGHEWVKLSGENAYLARRKVGGDVYLAPKA